LSRLLSAADAARRLAATAPRWAFEYSILKDVLFSSCKSAALLPSPCITLTVSSMSRRSAFVLAWRRDVAIRRGCASSAAVVDTLTVLSIMLLIERSVIMGQTKSSVVSGCLLGFLTSRPFLLIFQRPGCRACVPYRCPVTPHVLHFSL